MPRHSKSRIAALVALIVVVLTLTACQPRNVVAGKGKLAGSTSSASPTSSPSSSSSLGTGANTAPSHNLPSATPSGSSTATTSAPAASSTPSATHASSTHVAPPVAAPATPAAAPPANLDGFCRKADGNAWDYVRTNAETSVVFQTLDPSNGIEYWRTAGFWVMQRIYSNGDQFQSASANSSGGYTSPVQILLAQSNGTSDWVAAPDYWAKTGQTDQGLETASYNDYMKLWRAIATASPAAPSC